MANYKLYFDGSCGPKNPGGTAKYGFALFKDGRREPIELGHGTIGTGPGMTNNLAEFTALKHGLARFLYEVGPSGGNVLHCIGDSQLVIKIMNRIWHASADNAYFPACVAVENLCDEVFLGGNVVDFKWIPREQNQQADDLSKI
jgi:ribonuclease HI